MQFHPLSPRLNTRLHPLNAISTPLQTPQFLCLTAAQYPGDVFFHFFNFLTQKCRKSQKINALPRIFAFTSFFMNRKKTHFFTKNKSGAKSLSVGCNPESSRTIFTSKKNEKKCNKHVLGIWMGIKIALI